MRVTATQALRILRGRGWNNTQVGVACGVNPCQVSRWAQGSAKPREAARAALLALLDAPAPDGYRR